MSKAPIRQHRFTCNRCEVQEITSDELILGIWAPRLPKGWIGVQECSHLCELCADSYKKWLEES